VDAAKKALGQIRTLCRAYPGQLTAVEVVGKVYLVLEEEPAVQDKTPFLLAQLSPKEFAKLVDAAREVYSVSGPFAFVNQLVRHGQSLQERSA
jgi:hypothetical protein